TAGWLSSRPVGEATTGRYYQQLTRVSSALAMVSDISMLMFGGELKRKERLSARLGDVLSQLYLASTVLRYYEGQGRPEADLAYVRWCVQMSLNECQVAFNGFFENLPNRLIAAVLRRIVFPWGDAWERPSDRLDHEIVQTMWSDSELRRRLTQYAYIGSN